MNTTTPNSDNNADVDAWIAKLSDFYEDSIPQEIQEEAINHLALTITDEQLWKLIQPHHKKGYWENAAKVLENIGFPRIAVVEEGLIEWLQDLNWPGARRIHDLLLTWPDDPFMVMIEKALRKADVEDDTVWIYWLQELILEKGVLSLLSQAGKAVLERADE